MNKKKFKGDQIIIIIFSHNFSFDILRLLPQLFKKKHKIFLYKQKKFSLEKFLLHESQQIENEQEGEEEENDI